MSPTIKQAALLLAAGSALAAPAHAAQTARTARTAESVRVCAFGRSPTLATDTQVARAVFRHLGQPYRSIRIGGGAGGDDDDKGRGPGVAELLKTRCDLFVGIPMVKKQALNLETGVATSAPYLDVSFVRFHLADKAATGSTAVAYRAPSQLIAAEEKDPNFTVENTPEDVIRAVVSGRSAQGIAWYPSLLDYEHAHPSVHFRIERTRTSLSDWQLTFAADPRNRALLDRVSHAVGELQREGALRDLTAPVAMRDIAWRPHHAAPAFALAFAPMHGAGMLRVAAQATPQADFAAEQAQRGKGEYAAECAMCHGAKLEGSTAPALVGSGFAAAKDSGMTVGGIYQYMMTNMPAEKPGQLKPEQYADIMAFLLQANGYAPSGKKLSPDTAPDDTTEFDSFMP